MYQKTKTKKLHTAQNKINLRILTFNNIKIEFLIFLFIYLVLIKVAEVKVPRANGAEGRCR